MSAVITAAGAFPTAIYSGLLMAALFYWGMVILGAFDLGLGHGHGHAGHAEGAHGGGHVGGHGEGHPSGHHTGHESGSDGHGLLEFLSVGQIPLSITVSAVVFIAWIVSMVIELLGRAPLGSHVPAFAFDALQGVVALMAGLVAGGFLVRPLRPLFNADGEHGEQHLEGRMVRITSGRVDARFGTAALPTNGPDLLLNVVCRPEHVLARDDQAVVVEYDRERSVYLVAPLPHLRHGFAEQHEPISTPTAPPVATSEPAPTAAGGREAPQ